MQIDPEDRIQSIEGEKMITRLTIAMSSKTLSTVGAEEVSAYTIISTESMRRIFLILVLLLLSHVFLPYRAIASAESSVTKNGITFYFDKSYEVGTFSNGDYWVLGPVTITAMSPAFNGTLNGWQVNPAVSAKQGLDGRVTGTYDGSLVPSLPYTSMAPVESIVKVISTPDATARSYISSAAVLTVVPSIPTNNGSTVFRPPYMGTTKPFYSTSSLRTDLLSSLAPVGTPPSLATVAGRFSKLRLEHMTYDQRPLRPRDAYSGCIDGYGPDCSSKNAEDILRLLLKDSLADKMPALIGITQHGIDQAYAIMGGLRLPGIGHDPSHQLMAAFAATMLDIAAAKTVLLTATGFEEDAYTTVGVTGKSLWGKGNTETAYWTYINGGGGNRGNKDPYDFIDGGLCGADYQLILSQSYKGSVLVGTLIPTIASTAWNPTEWAILKDYASRWVSTGVISQPDPCAPPVGTYGVDYGPDPSNPGMCILDADLAYYNNPKDFSCKPASSCGRYPDKNAKQADTGQYKSAFVGSMWTNYNSSSILNSIPSSPRLLKIN